MSFMVHPSKQNCSLLTAVAEGLGMNQAAVNPVWEPSSYSHDTANFNRKTIRTPRAFDAQGGGVRDVAMEVYYFPCSLLTAGPLVCPELDSSCHGHTLFGNHGIWLSFQNPFSLFQKEHFLLQRRDIVRRGITPSDGVAPS